MRLNPTDGAGWRSEEKKIASLLILLFFTLVSEANVADVQVAFDENRGDLRVAEDVKEMKAQLNDQPHVKNAAVNLNHALHQTSTTTCLKLEPASSYWNDARKQI